MLAQLCGASGANALDPTSYACLSYPPTYPVYQGQFAPNGNESGFCVGVKLQNISKGPRESKLKC